VSAAPSLPSPPPARRPLGRRQRRLRWTAFLLAAVLAAGGGALGWLYASRRAPAYRPGEENADITRTLARDLPPDAPAPRLVDVTSEAGLASFRSFAGTRTSQLPEDMGSGAAWGDYDNDGDDDLFLVAAGGPLDGPEAERAPSELFENLGAGRFRRAEGFPETRVAGMGAAWGDHDGDGWLDLLVTGFDTLRLFRNEAGRFTRVLSFAERRGFWSGASWADYDRDGDLDLYVCGYVRYQADAKNRGRVSRQYGSSVPYTLNPASFTPERNLLFRNDGRGGLREVARELGVDNPQGRSLSAVWHDFDDDGWLDLYVANDISDNVFYWNRQGRFQDVSHAAWVADWRGAMGLAVGDWNRDGDDDLFVSHWLAQENALYDSMVKDLGGVEGGRFTAGNLRFADVADQVGLGQIALPMVGWGTEFADFDADGWLDLVVANGSTLQEEADPRRLVPQLPFLFWNRRGEHFHDLAPASPPLAVPHVGRGLAVSDYDTDGDLDLLIVRHGEGVQLLRNDMQAGAWIELVLRSAPARGRTARGFAEGAVVAARVGDLALRRAVGGASYLSQSTHALHLGLGAAARVDGLQVRWPDGGTASYGPLDAGARWQIVQGEEAPRRLERPSAPAAARVEPPSAAGPADRERLLAFWAAHRAGMHALKVEGDHAKAAEQFRRALALDARHEDARYYLANCLAAAGDIEGALVQLDELMRLNPQSHRARVRWGRLRASSARSAGDLAAAESALTAAHRINPEETGALLLLGEIALLRGDHSAAGERFEAVRRTNPRAARALFLLGYLAWRRGNDPVAKERLAQARAALGPDWKPQGTTAEGDVHRQAHEDATLLAEAWQGWDGAPEPDRAFAPLARRLASVPRAG
jgi:tetratricopeptide (TPR) repeat protein